MSIFAFVDGFRLTVRSIKTKDSQALVLDAGHIAIESKLADQQQLKDLKSKRGRQYNDDDFRQLEDLMYDKLSLRLESAQVSLGLTLSPERLTLSQLLMGPDVDACVRALGDSNGSGKPEWHILEKINMSFSVQNAIINAPNITRFKIAGDLPELQVNFSDRKYSKPPNYMSFPANSGAETLMKFIDVAIPKFDDKEAPQAQVPPPSVPGPQHHFRRRPVEEYNLDDTRSIISARTTDNKDDETSLDGKGGDEFYEARDDTTEVSALLIHSAYTIQQQRVELQQVTFEFSFAVGKLRTSLFKSTSSTAEHALADAILEDFGLTFGLRKYDMSVDLFLRSATLAMVEQGQTLRPLLSSADDGGTNTDLKLLQVRYLRVQPDSPEFMAKHEGVNQSIDIELSTFRIVIAPEPILSLYDFIMTTFVPHADTPSNAHEVLEKELPETQPAEVESDIADNPDKIRVRIKLTSAQGKLLGFARCEVDLAQ